MAKAKGTNNGNVNRAATRSMEATFPVANHRDITFDPHIEERMTQRYGRDRFLYIANQARELLVNHISTARRQWLDGGQRDQVRNVTAECRYPANPTVDDYYRLYRRHPIAARVVELMPKASWQTQPYIYEDENEEVETQFELAWKNLCKGIGGLKTWHKGSDTYNPVWAICQKADELAGIGHYGILFIGFDDLKYGSGRSLRTPAFPMPHPIAYPDLATVYAGQLPGDPQPITEPKRVLFLRAFDEKHAQIAARCGDTTSPRYGMPEMYNILFDDPEEGTQAGVGVTQGNQLVHWSRCIHIVRNKVSSEVFGMPEMEQVLDPILSLEKQYGASGEGMWQQAFGLLSFETHPQLGGDVVTDDAALKDMMEMVSNGLQRWIRTTGMGAKMVSPAVTDPSPHIAAAIEAICIKLGCPIRIFKGSERGELASTQDDDAWNDEVVTRINNHNTPNIAIPLVDRCIMANALPEPTQGYGVGWPDITSRSAAEQASTANVRVTAMATYQGSGVDSLMTPLDFFTKELGYSAEDAREIGINAGWYNEAIPALPGEAGEGGEDILDGGPAEEVPGGKEEGGEGTNEPTSEPTTPLAAESSKGGV